VRGTEPSGSYDYGVQAAAFESADGLEAATPGRRGEPGVVGLPAEPSLTVLRRLGCEEGVQGGGPSWLPQAEGTPPSRRCDEGVPTAGDVSQLLPPARLLAIVDGVRCGVAGEAVAVAAALVD